MTGKVVSSLNLWGVKQASAGQYFRVICGNRRWGWVSQYRIQPPSRQLTKVSFCLKSQTARKEKNYTGINREEIKKKKIKRILKWNISGSVLTRRLQNVWQVYIKETAQSARQINRKLSREAAHTGHRKVQWDHVSLLPKTSIWKDTQNPSWADYPQHQVLHGYVWTQANNYYFASKKKNRLKYCYILLLCLNIMKSGIYICVLVLCSRYCW